MLLGGPTHPLRGTWGGGIWGYHFLGINAGLNFFWSFAQKKTLKMAKTLLWSGPTKPLEVPPPGGRYGRPPPQNSKLKKKALVLVQRYEMILGFINSQLLHKKKHWRNDHFPISSLWGSFWG